MNKKSIKSLSVDIGTVAVGVGVTTLTDPLGALVAGVFGPRLNDILKRKLSVLEQSRITRVYEQSLGLMKKKIDSGLKVSETKTKDDMKILLEGSLLAARDSYEDKKIPLLANLLSNAPFTNTPTENLVEVLKLTESYSYRKLCIISVVGKNLALSPISFKEKYKRKPTTETILGVYFDVLSLIRGGIFVQLENDNEHLNPVNYIADIITDRLNLYTLGRVLFVSLQLDSLDKENPEFKKVFQILKQ